MEGRKEGRKDPRAEGQFGPAMLLFFFFLLSFLLVQERKRAFIHIRSNYMHMTLNEKRKKRKKSLLGSTDAFSSDTLFTMFCFQFPSFYTQKPAAVAMVTVTK
jgi:hypothetical protein